MSTELRKLVDALAELYAAEGRPGGDEVAAALRRHRNDPIAAVGTSTEIDGQIRALCTLPDALPAAGLADAAWNTLPWHHSGLADGRIPEAVAREMITCEILGQRGPLKCDTCRVGLFAQTKGVDYPIRTHAAEETFIMLSGQGEWRMPPDAWRTLGPGEASHHPSMVEHQSRSAGQGFLAAWRWTGEIGLEYYTYRG
jgi:quercetin dioxygenase-like cupin family protein